jgi:hypothetical protein
VNIIIMAAPRRVPNWHSTLASAKLAGYRGAICVCLDAHPSEVPAVEKELYAHLGVKLQMLTDEEATAQNSRSPKIRALYNAIRCFRAIPLLDSYGAVVEDDLTFSNGFGDYMKMGADNSVLLGYCRVPIDSRDPLVERHDRWDATLFVACTGKTAHATADALEENLRGPQLPADNAMSTYWIAAGVRRWTLNPSIVQHLGDDALINPGDGIRRSPIWSPHCD